MAMDGCFCFDASIKGRTFSVCTAAFMDIQHLRCNANANSNANAYIAFFDKPNILTATSRKGYKKESARRHRLSVWRGFVAETQQAVIAEQFSDEQDFVKAGGAEIEYVKTQQEKSMNQPKIADTLHLLQNEDTKIDLVIIGCGPAGLALAAESARQGITVGLIGPDLPFTNNYGVWEDEFEELGLRNCIEHIWKDTAVYLEKDEPILVGRSYGRVSRNLLRTELLRRCAESGVLYLDSKVTNIAESPEGYSLIHCENGSTISCRLVTVASGAASGKFLEYEPDCREIVVQTAYGIEVEVKNSPYDPEILVFMDYRDYVKQNVPDCKGNLPTFLYAMPFSPTRVFFEETCLASRPAMPFEVLKRRLHERLQNMGIQISQVIEEHGKRCGHGSVSGSAYSFSLGLN
eukprot:TRINITY_DN939_c0_g1_i2.p1 TRINITY_DN939_c0_g1~~TRINITY_DN939_c0_g1_i2.p1  ORF type:complete len:442 (+),score=66.82 TRINITY_DN939_c0_g1_i2:113-1327(+)